MKPAHNTSTSPSCVSAFTEPTQSRLNPFVAGCTITLIAVASAMLDRFGSTQWYLAAGALIVARFANPKRPQLPSPPVSYTLLSVLVLWGFLGSVIGRVFLGFTANSLALFFPMLLVTADRFSRSRIDVAQMLSGLRLVGYAYCSAAIAVTLLGVDLAPLIQFRHQTSFFLALSFAVAISRKDKVLLFITVSAFVSCFAAYPALTYIVVAFLTLSWTIVFFTPRRYAILVSIAFTISLVILIAARQNIEDWRIQYFRSVAKTDNSRTRETLLRLGVDRVSESPAFGNWFTENIAVRAPASINSSVAYVPYHNDYLQLAVAGGLLFTAMWIGVLAVLILQGMWRVARGHMSSQQCQHTYVVNVFLSTMLVIAVINPVLIEPGAAICLAVALVLLRHSMSGRASE
ncbi:O-antigen ligase family protein [Rhodococcoides corynebacterioides]|uniref:O-antigen ligase family protein n=1 Tax=Rhodococcoides corynebacterioides TaxID=53972 RepID=UPI001C9AB919|nr:O-antigen ligase family protein [Rhodococcus corynebacterioides]MBY6349122.1 O-antigen ligase family protein [Rhodococcus corynebacterioides]